MLASVQMLEREKRREEKERREEIKRERKLGEAKNTLKLAKRMVKENLAIELIEKITGLKREKFM